MDVNNVTNIIGGSRYKLATNQNTNVQIGLEETTKPLTEFDIIDIVNQNLLSQQEREACTKYRFNGKLNIYTSNVLSSGSTAYVNGVFDDSSWNPMFYGNPPVAPSNWVMQVTYPSVSDFNYLITSRTPVGTISSNAYRGLQYQSLGYTIINNSNYLTISGVQNHNLSEGDFIYIYSNIFYNSLQGIYTVRSLGINGNNTQKDLTLDVIVDPTYLPTGFGNFVKIVNPSPDDISFNNTYPFIAATATDITGGTTGSYSVGETLYTKITTYQPHNLIVNDFVDIRIGAANQTLNGTWRVYNIIGTSGTSTQFIIRASISNVKGTNITFPGLTPQYRFLDGTPSEYYIRKFEVLTSNQYEVYPAAFSSNIYSDVSDITLGSVNGTWLFQFNQDVNTQRLVTNTNGSVTEFYYTITKRSGTNPYNWSDVVADWDFNFSTTNTTNGIETISKNNPTGIGSIEKYSGRTESIDANGNIQITQGSLYVGDFIDYNSALIQEITIAEVIHRFGVNTNPNGEGYYYKPFKKLEVRKYSNNIEVAGPNEIIIDVPQNYVTYADGSIAWRDILTIGYYEEGTNGVDYPFLNGANYLYFNHNLYIRRQTPPPATLINQTGVNIMTNINEKC